MTPSLLNRLFPRPNRAARRAKSFRPAMEALDRRDVPAVVATFTTATGTLAIVGDADPNAITVTQEAGGNLLVNGGAVMIGGGPATAANTTLVTIEGGAGADTLTIDGSVSSAIATVLTGGTGDDAMFGGAGADTFVWNPGDGSDVTEGGAGTDTLQFNGSNANENIDLSNNGGRLRFFRDVASITIDAAGVETVNFTALGGTDKIVTGDLTGLGVQTFNIDLAGTLGGVTGDTQTDQVIVTGTAAADTVTVSATGGVVTVSGLAAVVNVKTAEPADVLNVLGLAGNDTISAEGVAAGLFTFTADGGDGDDTITGTDGADVLRGGTGNDFLDGARGNDTGLLGDGDDTFLWNPGDGNDLIEGGAGSDTMLFNGAAANEVFDVSANGDRVRFTRDVGNIVMDLNDVEAIDLNALGGADAVTANDLTGTDLTRFNVDLAAAVGGATGDTQADSVTLNGTAAADTVQVADANGGITVSGGQPATVVVRNAEATDALRVNGGDGDDTINAATLVTPVLLTLDGGGGNDRLAGSKLADLLLGGDGDDFIDGNQGDDVAFLGAGNDVFQWDPGDGSDVVEGQAGTDELLFNGANANENIDISANGKRARFFRDVASITMDLNETERVTFNALGGADTVLVRDLSGTAVTDVFVNLGGSLATPGVGDGKADVVTVTGTPGNDTITATVVGGEVRVTGLPAVTHLTGTDPSGDRLLANGGGGADTIDLSAVVTALPQPGLTSTVAAGADAGGPPTVATFNPDGSAKGTTTAFDAGFTGGVRVAQADINGDGTEDTVVGTGPGVATRVRVLDGKTGTELFAVSPFEASFTGGVFVAAADLDGDGKAELVITPDQGGGPRVRVLSGADGSTLADFFGIEDTAFRGGARAALGDLNGDGRADLLVAAGFGGGPRLAGFDGKSVAGNQPVKLFSDFFVFEQTLRNGVFVAAGDLDGDGFADLIAGGGPGGGPRVFALSGKSLVQSGSANPTQVANFFAGNPDNRGGIRLAVKNLDGDARADLVVGAGTGAGSRVTAYAGKSIPANGVPPEQFALDAFAGFAGGVFVG